MRREITKYIRYLMIMFLGIMVIGSQSCAKEKEAVLEIVPIQTTVQDINVSVDPRVELLSVVQMLGSYNQNFGLMTNYDFGYKEAVMAYFAQYKSHKAVKLFEEMSLKGFSYDAPPNLMLYLNQSFTQDTTAIMDKTLISRAGGEEKVQEFIDALGQFAVDTNFGAFYVEHQGFYKEMIDKVTAVLEKENYIQALEAYYGMNNTSYNIILAPLHRGGGFGPRITNEEESHVYSILGPVGLMEQIPVYGDEQYFDYIVWHEFSHSFINPLTQHYSEDVAKSVALFQPISEKMARLAYADWTTSLNEHMIRTVTARRTIDKDNFHIYEQAIHSEKQQGFFYIEILSEQLAIYEENREKYPSLDVFYPEIIQKLASIKVEELEDTFFTVPFTGPINAALQLEGESVLIVPSKEEAQVQTQIEAYCKAVSNLLVNNLGLSVTLVSDEEALKMDLSDKNIIGYGTLEGNQWFRAYQESFPFQVKQDKVITDKSYEGDHLRFITVLPHPSNPIRSLLIYTATNATDLININAVNHGMTDYVIAQGDNILVQDNYHKTEDGWTYSKQ